MKARPDSSGYGFVIRDLVHGKEVHSVAFGWQQENSGVVLRISDRQVTYVLQLLKDAGELLTYDADTSHPFTRPIQFPEGRRRLVVIPNCAERLRAERIARGVLYDASEAARAARGEARV